jgi:hypothetical protein
MYSVLGIRLWQGMDAVSEVDFFDLKMRDADPLTEDETLSWRLEYSRGDRRKVVDL